MKPYPKYKDSGVEWIGEVPEHWNVAPIRSFATSGYKAFTDGDWIESPYIREEGIRLIQTGNIGIGEYREQGFRYIDEETFLRFHCTEVKAGDILICRLANPVGRACLAPDLGVCMITSVDVCILKPHDDNDARFIVYGLSSTHYLSWMSAICRGGTRNRVSRSMLGSILLQKPPLNEQRTIAAYLDRKTAQIDNLISTKQKLIELLKEERAAIINQAVTKGLNPDVPMKDSGIEWLGEIPAHWVVKKIKYLLKSKKGALKTGPFGSQLKNSDMSLEGFKVYNQRSVLDKDFDSGDLFISNEKFLELRDFEVFPGDLLLTSRGTIGKCAIFPSNKMRGILHPCLIRIQLDQDLIINDYAELFIQNSRLFAESVAFNSNATTIDVIYGDTLRAVDIVLPPSIKEQNEIVMFVKKQTTKIDQTISKIKKQIDLLQEFRTALISEVVTGKIDVRDEGLNG